MLGRMDGMPHEVSIAPAASLSRKVVMAPTSAIDRSTPCAFGSNIPSAVYYTLTWTR